MKCQFCGADFEDSLDVCPNCQTNVSGDGGHEKHYLWCTSCGAPIPVGARTCEVCGMPVEGAFDDGAVSPLRIRPDVLAPTGDVEGFINAVPLAHETSSEEERRQESRHRHRVLALSMAAAFVVIAGTTVFITRPWDPNAYAIHSFTDADTSMEGYPGYMSHLSSQDKAADADKEAHVTELRGNLDAFSSTMDTIFHQADEAAADLESFFSGEPVDTAALAERTVSLKQSLDSAKASIEATDFKGSGLEERRDNLMVLCGYLDGELMRLVDATACVRRESDRAMAVSLGRAQLAGEVSDYSMQEYRELYANAVATYGF